ncbi:pyridoxamine 5'-phosphate oxidase family protein [Gammaproteobacteria bacterium]|jgi:pyridoxamine 5'-phosphate oxidase|nr:pyridoxamine 5'-phosphate oxidase family protein [Gammaproteobacteria bacterium]
MIKFINTSHDSPYIKFKESYENALNSKQNNINAICISSFSKKLNEVNARFVNLKFIDRNKFIFFSNYNSQKSLDFIDHDQITATLFWNKLNLQIRLKANIKRTPEKFNKDYFKNRSKEKNALAISSSQSSVIDSYEQVISNYNKIFQSDNLSECPDYWGGYSFVPYYFEFWVGHESRLNRRDVFELIDGEWRRSILQP